MSRFPLVLLSVAMTFCCWGAYGPVLHEGQLAMGASRWRPFICVGIAYFLVAVLVPLFVGRFHKEPGGWTFRGVVWSVIAGVIGSLGALGIICAFTLGARPIYVMPLVFGCAPIVNTFVTMFLSKTGKRPGWVFYVGILTVALGAAGVLVNKPRPSVAPGEHATHAVATTQLAQVDAAPSSEATDSEASNHAPELGQEPANAGISFAGLVGTMAAVLMTICCWGSYGPLLHRGQARMGGSRMRPFICVGVAYFFVAILIPSMILSQGTEQGGWTMVGGLWSLLAGCLGAVGALGIIMAFTFGGRPVYVMPLVFGGAPVINTATTMVKSYIDHGSPGTLTTPFLASLGLVIAGATTVLIFAPRPAKPEAMDTTGDPSSPEPNLDDASAEPNSGSDSKSADPGTSNSAHPFTG